MFQFFSGIVVGASISFIVTYRFFRGYLRKFKILTGKEAKRFHRIIVENETKAIPQKDYLRAKNTYEQVKRNNPDFL